MRDFGHHIGEDTEIYFSLYDAKKQKYVSERFLVKISKEGFSNYVEKLHSNCTVFTDLGNADLTKDMYVVAHVMRIGKMLYSESSKKTDKNAPPLQQVFKRPHGVAVQNMGDMVAKEGDSEEREFTMKVITICFDPIFFGVKTFRLLGVPSRRERLPSAARVYNQTIRKV